MGCDSQHPQYRNCIREGSCIRQIYHLTKLVSLLRLPVRPFVICLPSETVTLVLADCLFVESLFQDGFTYESVAKRRIYPLFQAMFGPAPDLAALPVKSLIRGSALYGV